MTSGYAFIRRRRAAFPPPLPHRDRTPRTPANVFPPVPPFAPRNASAVSAARLRPFHISTAASPPPRYPARASRMRLSAASRSVKKEKSHGLGTFWMVTRMAPKGYTPGLRLASTTEASGMANLTAGAWRPSPPSLGVNAATSLRKHRWFEKTKSSAGVLRRLALAALVHAEQLLLRVLELEVRATRLGDHRAILRRALLIRASPVRREVGPARCPCQARRRRASLRRRSRRSRAPLGLAAVDAAPAARRRAGVAGMDPPPLFA